MAEMNFKLKPFNVPNYVMVDIKTADVGLALPSIHVSEVPTETLEKMCEEFKQAILRKAEGKSHE